MTDLQIFNNDRFGQVRIIPVDGELMFVAKDVCDCLEITKHRDAISRLDSDERGSVKLDTLEENKILRLLTNMGYIAWCFQVENLKPRNSNVGLRMM